VTSYLDALARLFLILRVRPWEANLPEREIGRAKVSILGFGPAAWLCDAAACAVRSGRP